MSKLILLIVTVAFPLFLKAQTGWFVLPTSVNWDVVDVHFINSDTGYISSVYKNLQKTTDGGLTWHEEDIPAGYFPRYFNANKLMFLIGGDYLTRSNDTAKTWLQLPIYKPYSLVFPTSDVGFVTVSYHYYYAESDTLIYFYKSIDSGKTWDKIIVLRSVLPSSPGHICFRDELHGMLGYDEQAYVDPYPNFYRYYHLLYTSDGGTTWKEVKEGATSPIYINSRRWLCWSRLSGIEFSTDDGLTWKPTIQHDKFGKPSIFFNPESIAVADSLTGSIFAVTRNGIWHSTDGGENFYEQKMSPPQFNSRNWSGTGNLVSFPTSQVGYIAGHYSYNDTVVFKTIDGGGIALSAKSEETDIKEFTLFPSAAVDQITISFFSVRNNELLELFDALGRKIYHTTISPNTTSHAIDVQKFASGTYFVRLGGKSLKFLKYR